MARRWASLAKPLSMPRRAARSICSAVQPWKLGAISARGGRPASGMASSGCANNPGAGIARRRYGAAGCAGWGGPRGGGGRGFRARGLATGSPGSVAGCAVSGLVVRRPGYRAIRKAMMLATDDTSAQAGAAVMALR